MLNPILRTIFLLLAVSSSLFSQVSVKYPSPYIVIQRDNNDEGTVYITGTLQQAADHVEARFARISNEPGQSSENWIVIDNTVQQGSFLGQVKVKGGRYNLEVRAIRNGQQVGNITVVEKVGIGEVFLIVGHSNAQGSGGYPAQSNMVICMDPNTSPANKVLYDQTGNAIYLPTEFSAMTQGRGMSPFSGNLWFWGRFGDLTVERLRVPVLVYQAAFGGSNMKQTAMAARGEYFHHDFVKWEIRMPYINIENSLNHLVPATGLRAIISAHGINDGGSTEEEFYQDHKTVIDATRSSSKFANLAWMVANSCYNNGVIDKLATAQERLIIGDNVFRGARLNDIDNSGRTDGLHFNEVGQERAAQLWRDAVSDDNFLRHSAPVMPDAPQEPAGALPVVLVEFTANETEAGQVGLSWTTTEETNNSHFEVQYSYDARDFHPAGIVNGEVESKKLKKYHYTVSGLSPGNVYFRLKQVDLDGTVDFSQIVSVRTTNAEQNVFHPNPSDGVFEFRSADGRPPRSVRIYDLSGVLLFDLHNSNRVDLGSLPAATYLAVVEDHNGVRVVRKLSRL